MIRAGVFIGIDRTGGLQRLNDAASGAERMHQWALSQGMADQTHARLITDKGGGKVDPDAVFDAIHEIIDGPGADQLILYFAGHGVNINRCEHWLLTDAPVKPSAAVNVSGSVELARYCGIRHVVIISDACRVAPEGIQAQSVRGVDVFPNESASDRANPVDQFFACVLGRTAAEIKDPAVAASSFSALYTQALLDALSGKVEEVLEAGEDGADTRRYVKPVKLESWLEKEIPRRILERQLQNTVNQSPDAILIAHPNWISRVEVPAIPRAGATRRGRRTRPRPATPPSAPAAAADLGVRAVTTWLVQKAVENGPIALVSELPKARGAAPSAAPLIDGMQRLATDFGPDHFESECGIKVRGTRIVDFYTSSSADLLGTEGNLLRVHEHQKPAVNVLLRFEGGRGTVLPAIPGFLTAVTVEDGELVDVAYEPSANTWRWDLYKNQAAEVRTLRAVAASASQQGRFRLDKTDAAAVARKMQYAKGVDPTLAVYAAHAYHDLQDIERIRNMAGYMRRDLRTVLFDVALLGRLLVDKTVRPGTDIVPFVPLLSQSWALLRAHRVRLDPLLDGIENTVLESLWTLFDVKGLDMLSHALKEGERQ